MPRFDITSKSFVHQAMDEYNTIGREAFFNKYGRGTAKRYYAVDDQGREYESKAIYAAAHLLEFGHSPEEGGTIFHGGLQEVVTPLRRLGIQVRDYSDGQVVLRNCVYPTDPGWISVLSNINRINNVNFWRKDTRALALLTGSTFYFKPRGSRRIAGRAIFRCQETMTIEQAWNRFGVGNGVQSVEEFESRAKKVLQLATGDITINCLILDGVELLPSSSQPEITEADFPGQIVGQKFFPLGDLSYIQQAFGKRHTNPAEVSGSAAAEAAGDFDPSNINAARTSTMREVAARKGQGAFRQALLQSYGPQCAVSGATAIEVLEAAHIHPYQGAETNHIQNGLLLRSDWHTLFDLGFWAVEDDFTIRVSSRLTHPAYASFQGQKLQLAGKHRPSREALRYHRDQIFLPYS